MLRSAVDSFIIQLAVSEIRWIKSLWNACW